MHLMPMHLVMSVASPDLHVTGHAVPGGGGLQVTSFFVFAAPTVTILLFVFAAWRDAKIRSAQLLLEVNKRLNERRPLSRILNEIQYDRFVFIPERRDKGGDLDTCRETELTEYLDFLNVVCGFAQRWVVSQDFVDRSTVGYAIYVTTRNRSVKDYLLHIDRYDANQAKDDALAHGRGRRLPPAFDHLRSVGRRYHGKHWLG